MRRLGPDRRGPFSRTHASIVGNLNAFLHARVRPTHCDVFANDMKVRLSIAGDDLFYYPDVLVACDPAADAEYYSTRPCLIIEVLSKHTERTDRREKFLAYRTLPSLAAYLLVSQQRRGIEVLRRDTDWAVEAHHNGAVCLPRGLGELPLDAVYEGVKFRPEDGTA